MITLRRRAMSGLDFYRWPVEIMPTTLLISGDRANSESAQMRALESVGLVSEEKIEKSVVSMSKSAARIKTILRYNLSATGEVAVRKPGTNVSALSSGKSDLCYGKRAVDKIV